MVLTEVYQLLPTMVGSRCIDDADLAEAFDFLDVDASGILSQREFAEDFAAFDPATSPHSLRSDCIVDT